MRIWLEVKVSKTGRAKKCVSDLIAHDIVNMATKVGVVTNTCHIQNITNAWNTEQPGGSRGLVYT